VAELIVLGSGTGLPNAKRSAPGYLLAIDGKSILLDSGSGTLQRLINHNITYQDIDYILYSHLHPDHTLDFVSVLFAARNSKNPRRKDLTIIGPKGFTGFYNKLLAIYGTTITPESYSLIIKETSNDNLDLDYFKIFTKGLEHAEGSIGFKIELKNGKRLTYSGDTDYCENILLLSKDVDILILECSTPDEFKKKGHLTPSVAGRIASESHCKKLILTHMYPICDRYPILKQCKGYFKGKIILAKDNMKIRL